MRIDPDGTSTIIATDARIGGPGIALDSAGNIYTAGYLSGEIVKVTPAGEVTSVAVIPEAIGPGPGSNYDELASTPETDAAFGGMTIVDDVIYAASIGTGLIFEVRLDGTYDVIAGDGNREIRDGIGTDESFVQPNRLGYDPITRKLYISEYEGKALRSLQL